MGKKVFVFIAKLFKSNDIRTFVRPLDDDDDDVRLSSVVSESAASRTDVAILVIHVIGRYHNNNIYNTIGHVGYACDYNIM